MKLRVILPVAVIVGALSACGGSSKTVTVTSTPAGGTSQSRSDFIKEADKLCAEYHPKLKPFDQRLKNAQNRGDYATAARTLQEELDLSREEEARFRAIPRPTGDRAILSKLDATTDYGYAIGDRIVDALKQEDDGRTQTLADELRRTGSEAKALEAGYGFTVCGQD